MLSFSDSVASRAGANFGMVDIQSDLFTSFYEALRALPSVDVMSLSDVTQPGGGLGQGRDRHRSIIVTSGDISLELIPIIRREVFPRDARLILWDLQQRMKTMDPGQTFQVPVVIAQGVSAGARSILREAGASYYDLTGSIYLLAKGLYLFVDKPAPKRLVKLSQALFSGLRRRIVHRLLEHPETWFSVADLADRAGASTATTSQTLLLLEKHEWVEASGRGPTKRRRLLNPGSLAEAWAESRRLERHKTAHLFTVPTNLQERSFAAVLAEHCAHKGWIYAFTDLVAGQLHLGRELNVQRMTCYMAVNENVDNLLTEIGSMRSGKGNLTVVPMPNDPSWIECVTVEEIRIVDPIEVYIDLIADGETAVALEIRKSLLPF
jgi:DNA-binding MarR family transcriptional regulator